MDILSYLPHFIAEAADPTVSVFGGITPPSNPIYDGSTCGGGLVMLMNIVIKLVFVIGGLFALWKLIEAGFGFIGSGGDPQAISDARSKIIMTFVGLLVMVGAFALAGVIGLLFFGDSSALLNPSLTGVGECTT